jgi:ammonia channel protein AmtB
MRKPSIKVGRVLVFIVLWTTLVYDPIARWTWSPGGWSRQRGVMDFAGGTAVHITSGTAVAAFSNFWEFRKGRSAVTIIYGWWRGLYAVTFGVFVAIWRGFFKPQKERTPQDYNLPQLAEESAGSGAESAGRSSLHQEENELEDVTPPMLQSNTKRTTDSESQDPLNNAFADDSPHNANNIVLGTALLWIGWFGFNGGSALGGNLRAVSACLSTHTAACSGGSTALLLRWILNATSRRIRPSKQGEKSGLSVIAFCDGVIIGLVAITPAAGYVRLLFRMSMFLLN